MTSSKKHQKHSLTFYALIVLIILQVLLPKSVSEIFGLIPTRLMIMTLYLIISGYELLIRKIRLNAIKLWVIVIPYVAFLLLAIPSITVSPNKLISVYTIVKFIVFLLVFITSIKIEFSSYEYKIIAGVFVILVTILVLQGFYEYYFDPQIFKIGIEHYVGARGRISTTFFNTIYYGIFVNFIFVYLLIFYMSLRKIRYRIVLGILLLMVYCNLIFTFTRSSFMIFWGILVLLFFFYHRIFFKKSVLLILVLLITMTLTISGSVSFVTTSFESTISLTSTFSDVLNIIPNFFSIGKKTIPVSSIQLDQPSFVIKEKGATLKIEPRISPENATNQSVIWSTDNPEVASVNEQGIVTALKNGTVILTAKTKDGNKTATAKVTVEYVPIVVTAIHVTTPEISLDGYKKTATVDYKIIPENAENQAVVWSSSDENVAKVDQNGKLTALFQGTATITISTQKGDVFAQVFVTVNYPSVPVTDIKLNSTEITLESFGSTKRLVADVFPKDATIQDVTFLSSDTTVATIDGSGTITAKGNGIATIKVSSYNGAIESFATVIVTYEQIAVNGISFAKSEIFTSSIGKKIGQNAIISPAKATIKQVNWYSSDQNVATVDTEGEVTPLKDGSVIITAVTVDGGFSATYELTIKKNVPIPDYSLIHRNEFAKIAYRIGSDHFFTGIGFGSYLDFMDSETFTVNYPDYQLTHTHPHSSIILLFAETGALAMMAFLIFAIGLIWMSIRNFLSHKNSNSFASKISRALPTVIIGFLIVCSIAENAVYDTQIFPLFLIITGLSFSFCASQKEEKAVLFVASSGGHLTELLRLSPLFSEYHSILITEKTEMTKHLNMESVNVAFLGYASRANMIKFIWINFRNALASVVYFFKYAPKIIVSTGANTAVPLCVVGKMLGAKIIFIETVANSERSSISGKLVYPFADLFIVQWESMLVKYPKAVYWGWLF